jgi:hypothetical protein
VREELDELSNRKGKLTEASSEGQGSRRAVEPMMVMMMMINYLLFYAGVSF